MNIVNNLNYLTKKISFVAFICVLLFASCSQEEPWTDSDNSAAQVIFKLQKQKYENDKVRASDMEEPVDYDQVYFYIVNQHGYCVENIKSFYDSATSEIYAEGLHEGDYYLLVLGIKGDNTKDRVEIRELSHGDNDWLIFPKDLQKPLEAEYFYSRIPFSVISQMTENGDREIAIYQQEVKMKRIISRIDFEFEYQNPYIRNTVIDKTVQLNNARFYTKFSGNGKWGGESNGEMDIISLNQQYSYFFLPVVDSMPLCGEITLSTENYRREQLQQVYEFNQGEVISNQIHTIETSVHHPDDKSVVMFLNQAAYKEGNYSKILQDNERKEIYTDQSQRKFNTARPLQVSITNEGKLHVRFYSPRSLKDVLVKTYIPEISGEYIDLAYFDSIPAFADFYEETVLIQRSSMARTESGKIIEIPKQSVDVLQNAVFKIESSDNYWYKLKEIKHGWNIYWGLYGGNPDRNDGGPVGNWMGIRPVHCRESVALFLNFTYMIDMPEHEEILKQNADRLYDDNGKLVEVDKVLRQMRQERTLQVGLVYPGNGVIGLGGGSTFGAYQQAWLQHYWNTYSCEIMFHELGHVMGYGHNSSFTYGPWAQELMNHFYVNNLDKLPVNASSYLNSSSNPYLYK